MPQESIANGGVKTGNTQIKQGPRLPVVNRDALFACPIQGVIDVISKKWALLIVAVLGSYTSLRYNGLLQEINGISPKTLADTLKDLEKARILKREAFNEIPPRVEYSLTEDGLNLREAVVPMLKWAVDRSKEKDCIVLKVAMQAPGSRRRKS